MRAADRRPREIFPVEDVRRCARDVRMQEDARRQHGIRDVDLEDLTQDVRELLDDPAEDLTGMQWIYFSSPDWTWDALCGRAGWLLWNPQTEDQVYFDMTVLS